MNIFTSELKRAILNKKFFLLLLAGVILFCIDMTQYYGLEYFFKPEQLLLTPSAAEAWFYGAGAVNPPIYVILAPILVVLPFSDSYWLDKNTNFYYSIVMRCKHTKYFISKFFSNIIAGGLVVSIPPLLILSIVMLIFPLELSKESFVRNYKFYTDFLMEKPYQYILLLSLLKFVFGSVYSTLALAVSTISNNKYLAMGTPYVFYLIATLVAFPYMDPSGTFSPFSAGWNLSITFIIRELSLIMIVSSVIYFIMAIKRSRI
ncbi:hypothetical protein EDC19_2313 [Natranaerovirga hydrolytica]|uniref:ABC-2 family transporter n=1 Tax=Natranaerovirga hydrolytica TaxID=680378 RepID=A0A4R1MHD7_9FIRM|nr:hypothetical protein [Natranaerovirga hydrolytica]TCK90544.1 hypothetical protein EDC19_2313 [Natranaerovirga hydrolytica]